MRAIDRLLRNRPKAGGLSLLGKIRALFANGEQGWWYDPSNYGPTGTLLQDSAGTTPVTAMEQPVGLQLDLSKGLVLGPNVVPTAISDALWMSIPSTPPASTVSGNQLTFGGQFSGRRFNYSSTIAGVRYEFRFTARRARGNTALSFFHEGSASGNTTAFIISDTATEYVVRPLGNASGGLVSFGIQDRNASGQGTIEVTNISVRELPGNHRFQTTSANRPVVSARVNLLTGTDGFTGATITPATGLVVVATGQTDPRGGNTARQIRNTTTTEQHRLFVTTTAPGRTLYSVEVKDVDAGFVQLSCSGTVVAGFGATFNLAAKTYTLVGTTLPTASITELPNGFLRLSVLAPATETATNNVQFYVLEANATTVNPSTTGTAKSVIIAGADLRVANIGVNLPAYQRVNTSTDYDSTGFPIYIKPNGSNQFMQTNSINFTATDKMTVWQGVRKLSDVNAVIAEISTNGNSVNSSFLVNASDAGRYVCGSRGTITSVANTSVNTFIPPITNVLTGIGDISGDVVTLRVNGVQAATSSADQGTGNYGNYPAYFYARASTTFFFNGHDYGSIARGAASTAAQITAGETYINSKTKAFV